MNVFRLNNLLEFLRSVFSFIPKASVCEENDFSLSVKNHSWFLANESSHGDLWLSLHLDLLLELILLAERLVHLELGSKNGSGCSVIKLWGIIVLAHHIRLDVADARLTLALKDLTGVALDADFVLVLDRSREAFVQSEVSELWWGSSLSSNWSRWLLSLSFSCLHVFW